MIYLENKNSIFFKFLSFLLILSLLFMGVMPFMTPIAHAEVITTALVCTGVAIGVGILLSNYSAMASDFQAYLDSSGSSEDFLSGITSTATSYVLNSSAWSLIYPFLNSYVDSKSLTTSESSSTYYGNYQAGVYYDSVSLDGHVWTYSVDDSVHTVYLDGTSVSSARHSGTPLGFLVSSTGVLYYYTSGSGTVTRQYRSGSLSTSSTVVTGAISPNFNNNMNTHIPSSSYNYVFTSVGSDIDSVTKDSTVEISTTTVSSGTGSITTSPDYTGLLGGIRSLLDSIKSRLSSHADSFVTDSDTVIPDFSNTPPPFYDQPTVTPNPDGSSYHGGWLKGLFLALGLDKLLDSINSFWSLVLEWIGSISAFLSFYANFLTLLPRAMVLPLYGSIVLGAILVFIRRFTA